MKTYTFKKIFTVFSFLITISLFSQNSDVKVVDLKPAFNDNKFPEVRIKDNLKIQNKINTFLQLEHLEHLPNIFKKNPYEKLRIDEEYNSYRTLFSDWTQQKTTKNILSLVINGEFNGAYLEEFSAYNNFDIRTGNKITLNNILSKEGEIALTKILKEKVNTELREFLKEIKEMVPADEEEKEMITFQKSLYEDCLESNQTYTMEYYDFTFQNDSIVFFRGRCSNHAMRALDDLDRFEYNFSYKEIEKYLSAYGKNLCVNKTNENTSKSVEGKMFKGKINDKYPITAIIQDIRADKSVQIIYWYDKYNQPIEWFGKFEKNQFHLNEDNENGEKISIVANYSNDKIIGNWTNKTTNKTLKLELNEY